ncbi:MAG: hypothetical protein LIP09_08825 [Bacteroidales bacterium]|nr:hypothetical protein [Bacteroidales bacterium]
MRKFIFALAAAMCTAVAYADGEAILVPTALSPAEGEYDVAMDGAFDHVNLTFGGFTTVFTVKDPSEICLINVESGDEVAVTATYDATFSGMAGGAYMRLTFDEITTTGDYQLIIPQATFTDENGDYNPYLQYYYNVKGTSQNQGEEITFVSIDPAEYTEMAEFAENESIIVTFNTTEGVKKSLLKIFEDGEYLTQIDAVKTTDTQVTFTNHQMDWPMYSGRSYEFQVTLYDKENGVTDSNILFQRSFTYVGTTVDNITFSSVTVTAENFSPAPGSTLTCDNNVIVLSLPEAMQSVTGIITTGGQAANEAVLQITPDALNQVWTITVPASFLAETFGTPMMLLTIIDEYGAYVTVADYDPTAIHSVIYPYWDVTTGAYTEIALNYDCYEGGVTVDVTPAAGKVDSLSEFTFSYSKLITWGSCQPQDVKVYDADGAVAAYGESYTVDEEAMSLTLALNTTITAKGEYTLVVPQTALTLGTEFDTEGYKGQTEVYTIGDLDSISSIMAESSTFDVYNMQGIRVLSGASATDLRSLPAGLYIANGRKLIIR